jgi:predicted ester cyclase
MRTSVATTVEEGVDAMSEENKALIARMAREVFNEGKLEVIDEVISPDFTDHARPMPGMPSGLDGVKAYARAVRQAFPDLKNTISHVIAEGDLVAQHVTTTGTMQGEFAGMAPTGKQATWEAVHIGRVRDGKVVEHWMVQDELGMLQQLGFLPTPGAAKPAG